MSPEGHKPYAVRDWQFHRTERGFLPQEKNDAILKSTMA
jgi:hypothetical protein